MTIAWRASMRTACLAAATWLPGVCPANAGWSADPVQVRATTALCPQVAACPDGHSGAILVWQEDPGSGGVLQARHLLAGGDVDPAWPAPLEVCTTPANRAALAAVTDGAGGAYVWWLEGTALYLTRIAANGAIPAGWPARGRNLGTLATGAMRPSITADGTGGIYAAWFSNSATLAGGWVMRGMHLGPTNAPKDGWPAGGRVLGPSGDTELVNSADIAAAAEGGVWLAIATATFENPGYLAGDVRVTRLTGAGLPAPGWDAGGVSLMAFRGDLLATSNAWRAVPGTSLVAVAADGPGAFVVSGEVAEIANNVAMSGVHVLRVAADGSTDWSWPPNPVPGAVEFARDCGGNASLRALPDDHGGVFAGFPVQYTDAPLSFEFQRVVSGGTAAGGGLDSDLSGLEFASRGDGGMFIAAFEPAGPYGPFSPPAYVRAAQSDPGPGFAEYHNEPVQLWYGDVALASTGDGGAIFAWSQVKDRFGVFAVRLGPQGVVTSVPPSPVRGPPTIRLRFVSGVGVRALVSSVPSGSEDLSLFDITGRAISHTRIERAAGGDWVFPGTDALRSGIYFAQAVAGGQSLRARVAVVR